MREAVAGLWPEIQWIENKALREQVMQTWVKALERSPLRPDDLNQIPFTLLVPNCPITFMEHKRCVVHIARASAKAMHEFMGRARRGAAPSVYGSIAGAGVRSAGCRLPHHCGARGGRGSGEANDGGVHRAPR